MTCPRCGNNLAPGAAYCSVCGHSLSAGGAYAVPPPAAPPIQPTLSTMAIAGFVLAFLFPPVGLVLSILGRGECMRSEGRLEGGGFAIAGIVISVVNLVLSVLTIVVVLTVFHDFVHMLH
jgi:hypothetical protein